MDESITNLIEFAAEITSKHYTKEEIINILNSGDTLKMPMAILSLDELSNQNEAELLIKNLTGTDGRIREASAVKISEFLNIPEYAPFFCEEKNLQVILNGIMDINPNVGRALIDGIKGCPSLKKLLCPLLVDRIENLIQKLQDISSTPYKENRLNNKRNHAKNKVVFNLYWALEALYYTDFDTECEEKIISILNFTSGYIDYTIREKAAKIFSGMKNPPSDLLHKLKNDENFYVKNHLLC